MTNPSGQPLCLPRQTNPALGDIIGAFKSITTLEYIRGIDHLNWPHFHERLWQRNYHDHIIRDDNAWYRIHLYIQTNPARWAEDRERPAQDG